MNTARAAFGCHLNKEFGKVYVVGGSIDSKQATDECEVYDILKDQWTSLPRLPVTLCSSSVISLGDKYLFSFGGIIKQTGELSVISYIYRLNMHG